MIRQEIKMLAIARNSRPCRRANMHTVITPNQPENPARFDSAFLHGFIKHPDRFPLAYRKLRFWEHSKIAEYQQSNTGLTFSSDSYQKPGSILEITIPTRKETHQFLARVVMVKQEESGYELGVWLLNAEDTPKLRIIEQICHIELYLNDKRYKDGPFLSPEKLTEEWISRFASSFPAN